MIILKPAIFDFMAVVRYDHTLILIVLPNESPKFEFDSSRLLSGTTSKATQTACGFFLGRL